MIALEQVKVAYGPRTLFEDVNAQIMPGERIGLVGPNGSGKSTLLKILIGELEPDAGRVVAARGTRRGLLRQEEIVQPGRSIFSEVETSFPEILAARDELASLHERMHALDHASRDYREALERCGAIEHFLEGEEAHKVSSRISKVLSGLGFSQSDFDRDCGEFSGGWQMRIALAKLLLRQPELLLLDEPTNHLDLDSLRWFENYLNGYPGAILMVSHDRRFLNNLTNRTLALENKRLESYSGNFEFYEEESARRREQLEKAYGSQQKYIAQQQRFIERFRSKATKARQVQSRVKMLDKIERIELQQDEAQIDFSFPPAPRPGATLLELKQVTKRYGEQVVFEDFSFALQRGDRVAVVGVNGAGKSTLARLLAGRDDAFGGTREVGYQVVLGYFAQQQTETLRPDNTVLQAASNGVQSTREVRVRAILGAFLFRGDDVFKPVGVLSGGEKNRLALARLLLQPSNCLVLDEPTNHLDMASKDILQAALMDYEGSFFIVSHDRDFLDPIVNKVIEISTRGIRVFPGNVSDYVWKIENEEKDASRANTASTASGTGPSGAGISQKERRRIEAERRQRLAPLRKELEAVESRISELEDAIAAREKAMLDPEFFNEKGSGEKVREYDGWKSELEEKLLRWEQLHEKIESDNS